MSWRGSLIPTLCVGVMLARCAPPAPADPNRLVGPSVAIRAQCESRPTHLERERCANPRILELYRTYGNAPMDVAGAYLVRREAIAEKMDKGTISETEGEAEMADARVSANAQVLQRRPTTCVGGDGVTVCR
jgi:hypothetical protein